MAKHLVWTLFVLLIPQFSWANGGEVRPPDHSNGQPIVVGVVPPGDWWKSCISGSWMTYGACPGDGPDGAFRAQCRGTHKDPFGSPQIITTTICWKKCPGGVIHVEDGVFMCG